MPTLNKALNVDVNKSLGDVEKKLEECRLESSPSISHKLKQPVASTHDENKVVNSLTLSVPSLPAHEDESVGTEHNDSAVTHESSTATEASVTSADTSSASFNNGSQSQSSGKKTMWLRQPPPSRTQLKKKKLSTKLKKTGFSRSQSQDVSASKQTLLRNFFVSQTKKRGDQAQIDHE